MPSAMSRNTKGSASVMSPTWGAMTKRESFFEHSVCHLQGKCKYAIKQGWGLRHRCVSGGAKRGHSGVIPRDGPEAAGDLKYCGWRATKLCGKN